MFSKRICRLIGWSFFAMGLAGLSWGHIGDYMQITKPEAITNLCIGLVAISAARRRQRIATLTAFCLGFLLFAWGIIGLAMSSSILGTPEPLESVLRIVAGAWGLYASIQDILTWRTPKTA